MQPCFIRLSDDKKLTHLTVVMKQCHRILFAESAQLLLDIERHLQNIVFKLFRDLHDIIKFYKCRRVSFQGYAIFRHFRPRAVKRCRKQRTVLSVLQKRSNLILLIQLMPRPLLFFLTFF